MPRRHVAPIPLFKVGMSDDASAGVAKVLASGYVGQGPRVVEFEEALERRLGTPGVVTVNSATSGLHLALHMLATRASGASAASTAEPLEVLTTPLTCTATNWPILANGLRPRWVDVDPRTLNVDIEDVGRKVSPRTIAVVLVHWGGYPVEVEHLARVLDRAEQAHGTRPVVIEDCAHAWGSTLRDRPVGTHGNVAVFSFQAIKHLTCGDGGAVVCPDEAFAERARLLRWYGIDRTRSQSYRCEADIAEYGFKFHMNDINAVIGLANLETADRHVRRHRENAAFFDDALGGVPGLTLPERRAGLKSSFWLYTILVEDRHAFMARMAAAGIEVSPVHARNDRHSCVANLVRDLPGLDAVAEAIVCVPVGWWVDESDRAHIAEVIRAGW